MKVVTGQQKSIEMLRQQSKAANNSKAVLRSWEEYGKQKTP
jgi:hypothetical protein